MCMWVLHLLDDIDSVVAEAARVLRPGGAFITTVDKDDAHDVGSDIDALIRPLRRRRNVDSLFAVSWKARERGLIPAGETTFIGYGQGQSPKSAADLVRRGYFASSMRLTDESAAKLANECDGLPEHLTKRPDPVFQVATFQKRHYLPSHYYV